MGRLNEHLRFFVRKKLAEDAAWRRPRIVLSGHEVPGEGEHKIMEYIRLAKREPGYKPNMRHCMCAPGCPGSGPLLTANTGWGLCQLCREHKTMNLI